MEKAQNIIPYSLYFRGSDLVGWLNERSEEERISIHTSADLPLVRYKRGQSVEERNKPIRVEETITHKDKTIKKYLEIEYGKGAPSPCIYNILMAINWNMQERGFNDGLLVWDGISWICKKTGCESDVVVKDLKKLTGLSITGENLSYDLGTGNYSDLDITPYPAFVRNIEGGNKIPRKCVFEISKTWLALIQNNIIHTPQHYHDYLKLKSILAKLLFTRLMKIFYSRDFIRVDMEGLGRWLLLENVNIHSMKQTFDRACEELQKIGFLRKYSIKVNKNKTGYNVEFYGYELAAEDKKKLKPPDYDPNHKKIIKSSNYAGRKVVGLASVDTDADIEEANRIMANTYKSYSNY